MASALWVEISLLLATIFALSSSSFARDFYVGGRDGWVVNPKEQFGHWAERNRFKVNDTLVFKYEKGSDSVLVVNKEDYDTCNLANPIQRLDDGNSVLKFDHSGPFFFISGAPGNCQKGEKLIVVVLAVRNKNKEAPEAPSPSPDSSSPASPVPLGVGVGLVTLGLPLVFGCFF